jgi:hypothetical protein
MLLCACSQCPFLLTGSYANGWSSSGAVSDTADVSDAADSKLRTTVQNEASPQNEASSCTGSPTGPDSPLISAGSLGSSETEELPLALRPAESPSARLKASEVRILTVGTTTTIVDTLSTGSSGAESTSHRQLAASAAECFNQSSEQTVSSPQAEISQSRENESQESFPKLGPMLPSSQPQPAAAQKRERRQPLQSFAVAGEDPKSSAPSTDSPKPHTPTQGSHTVEEMPASLSRVEYSVEHGPKEERLQMAKLTLRRVSSFDRSAPVTQVGTHRVRLKLRQRSGVYLPYQLLMAPEVDWLTECLTDLHRKRRGCWRRRVALGMEISRAQRFRGGGGVRCTVYLAWAGIFSCTMGSNTCRS